MTTAHDTALPVLDVVVLNANTSAEVTAMLDARAREVARPGTRVKAIRPARGPASVEGWDDAYRSAAAMLERMADFAEPFDALVMAGFGDVGREALAEAVGRPVVDVTDAGALAARLLGEPYGVVTTTPRMVPLIERSLEGSGRLADCAGIVPMEMTIAELRLDPERGAEAFRRAAERAVDRGARALCIGSSAISDQLAAFAAVSPVPLVDPVAAAVGIAEVAGSLRRSSALHPHAEEDAHPSPMRILP